MLNILMFSAKITKQNENDKEKHTKLAKLSGIENIRQVLIFIENQSAALSSLYVNVTNKHATILYFV